MKKHAFAVSVLSSILTVATAAIAQPNYQEDRSCLNALDQAGPLSPGSFVSSGYDGDPASLLFDATAQNVFFISDQGIGKAAMGAFQRSKKQELKLSKKMLQAEQQFFGFRYSVPTGWGRSTPLYAISVVKYRGGALYAGRRTVEELPNSRFIGAADLKTRSVGYMSSIITTAPSEKVLQALGGQGSTYSTLKFPATPINWKLDAKQLQEGTQVVSNELQNRIYTLESAMRSAIDTGATREDLKESVYEAFANEPEIMRGITIHCRKSSIFQANPEYVNSLKAVEERYLKLRKIFGKK